MTRHAKRIQLPPVGAIGSDLADCRKELARYHGAVSAWCDLNGLAQPAGDERSKVEKEFDHFEKHLQELRHARRFKF